MKKVWKSPKFWGSWFLSIFSLHIWHFYAFTTPYIVFGEKSTEKSYILGQLSFVHFYVASKIFLCLHYSLYSLLWKKYRKFLYLGAVEFLSFLGGTSNVNSHHPDSRPCLDLDCTGGRLSVPPTWSADHSPTSPGFHRRRKLSTASKASTLREHLT